MFSLFSFKVVGQLLPGPSAYLLFEDKSSGIKFEYLYPEMIQNQKLTSWQNKAYAKLGVQSVVALKETTSAKDTVGIRKYNTDGFMIERDTLTCNENHYKSKGTWLYEYSLKEKKVTEVFQETTLQPEFHLHGKSEGLFYYNDKKLLIRFIGYANSKDTSSAYFEYYSNGVMKGYKRYHSRLRSSKDLNREEEHQYNYEFDKKGRVTNHMGTELVYDDPNHCVRFLNGENCYQIYYITKKRHIFQSYCCPQSKEGDKEYSHSKITTIFDNRSRIVSVTEAWPYRERPCEEDGTDYRVTRYKYNASGLLSEVSTDGIEERILFHYFDKNKREIR